MNMLLNSSRVRISMRTSFSVTASALRTKSPADSARAGATSSAGVGAAPVVSFEFPNRHVLGARVKRDAPAREHDNAVGQRQSAVQIVRHHYDGARTAEIQVHLLRGLRV